MARQDDLLSVEDARARILANFQRLETEFVTLDACHGRILADPITASIDIPPFANSSMDGFALQAESTRAARADNIVALHVVQHIAAGSHSTRVVVAGECARIMTGAPLPPGADAVIPFEEVEDHGTHIGVSGPIAPGASVRPAGQDITSGTEVLCAGIELDSRRVALLAALGLGTVPVVRRPNVAVLSTGDELIAPGRPLAAGQIYNSNSSMLVAAIVEAGGIPTVLPTVRDDAEQLAQAMLQASTADLLLTSGGASVGDFDYMTDVLSSRGRLNFWRVRVRPGKPLVFGSLDDLRVIGLPGNPTSGMVTFELFARPAIRRMLGASLSRPTVQVRLDERIDNRGGRRTYSRARVRYQAGEFHAALSGPQDSAMLMPLAAADGLVVVPEDRDELVPGEVADMLVWRLPHAPD